MEKLRYYGAESREKDRKEREKRKRVRGVREGERIRERG